uniref:Uncharacterized protein n=1 Tax=Pipistrellus kuhlii TaxID=59472 RepID=A0A7J7VV53_PIPKU|nr:hypothetical protein mPipKuh1_008242 [Pipistrellus kuhlii]
MFHIEVSLPWHPFDPKLQGLGFTYILHGDGQIWLPVLEAALAQMSAWKHLCVECDSLQLRRRGEGPWVTHSLPPRLPHFCGLHGSVSSSMTPSSLSDGVCVDKAWTEGRQPSPQVPASLSVPGRSRSVGSHTLLMAGSFQGCPGTHISCLFESVYVTGEAVKQQFACTRLFTYLAMSARCSQSRNSSPAL